MKSYRVAFVVHVPQVGVHSVPAAVQHYQCPECYASQLSLTGGFSEMSVFYQIVPCKITKGLDHMTYE